MDGGMEGAHYSSSILKLQVVENRVLVDPPSIAVHGTIDLLLYAVLKHTQGQVDRQMVLYSLCGGGGVFNVNRVLENFQKVEQGSVSSLGHSMSD